METGRSVCTLWSEVGLLRREGINKAKEMTSYSFPPCEIQQTVTSLPAPAAISHNDTAFTIPVRIQMAQDHLTSDQNNITWQGALMIP